MIGSEPESVKALWRTLARDLLKRVVRVLCYVNLCNRELPFASCGGEGVQDGRPAAETLSLVDDWLSAVGAENVDGFFLDDTPMDGRNGTIKYNVLAIVAGIRRRNSAAVIVTNPGVPAADLELLHAVSSTVYDEGPFPDSVLLPKTLRKRNGKRFPKRKFAVILHSVGADDWASYAETSKSDGYFYFYATDGSYSRLPPYLDDMLVRIAS